MNVESAPAVPLANLAGEQRLMMLTKTLFELEVQTVKVDHVDKNLYA